MTSKNICLRNTYKYVDSKGKSDSRRKAELGDSERGRERESEKEIGRQKNER